MKTICPDSDAQREPIYPTERQDSSHEPLPEIQDQGFPTTPLSPPDRIYDVFTEASEPTLESSGNLSLSDLQATLPWGKNYSQEFLDSKVLHKDFQHAVNHLGKAVGHLCGLIDDLDHDFTSTDGHGRQLQEPYSKYLADIVICALRAANTFPGNRIDLEQAVMKRLERNRKMMHLRGEH